MKPMKTVLPISSFSRTQRTIFILTERMNSPEEPTYIVKFPCSGSLLLHQPPTLLISSFDILLEILVHMFFFLSLFPTLCGAKKKQVLLFYVKHVKARFVLGRWFYFSELQTLFVFLVSGIKNSIYERQLCNEETTYCIDHWIILGNVLLWVSCEYICAQTARMPFEAVFLITET